MLNGEALADDEGALPALAPQSIGEAPIDVPPRSIVFVVFPDATATACL